MRALFPRGPAPTEIGELIEPAPGSLASYRPALRYLLIDEGAFENDSLAVQRNAVAALFRLVKSRGPKDARAGLRELLRWLKALKSKPDSVRETAGEYSAPPEPRKRRPRA